MKNNNELTVKNKHHMQPPHMIEHISWDELDKSRYYILGPTLSILIRGAVYPSNLVKTRLQVQSPKNPLYKGTFDAFRKIIQQEGFRGLYKGFGASVLNAFVGNIYVSVLEIVRKVVLQRTNVCFVFFLKCLLN